MTRVFQAAPAAAAIFLGLAAAAASAQTADGLSTGKDIVDGVEVGKTYTRETYGDWQMRCVRTQDKKDPCQLYQLLQDEQGNPVAEISVFNISGGGQAVAGATVATPLETLLTEQLTMTIDNSLSKRYPFSFCTSKGCYVRIGLTEEGLAAFKRGSEGTISIVPLATPDTRVSVRMSLKGFTKGYAAVEASNTALEQN